VNAKSRASTIWSLDFSIVGSGDLVHYRWVLVGEKFAASRMYDGRDINETHWEMASSLGAAGVYEMSGGWFAVGGSELRYELAHESGTDADVETALLNWAEANAPEVREVRASSASVWHFGPDWEIPTQTSTDTWGDAPDDESESASNR
jgi:hypothetical protein